MFSKSECDGFGNICGQIIITSLQSTENLQRRIPLDEALKGYLDMRGMSRELIDDASFYRYFLSFVEFRKVWNIAALVGALKHPDISDGKMIYDDITHSCAEVINQRYPMMLVEDDATFDALWGILERHQFRMNDDAMRDFLSFARNKFGISGENACEIFFMAENCKFEDIMIEECNQFVSNPKQFKGKSGCMASFAAMALIIGVPVGSAMWLL